MLLNHLETYHSSGYHPTDITVVYISPIPYMEFNDTLSEADFRSFIEAISNDIINWDTLKAVMKKRWSYLC